MGDPLVYLLAIAGLFLLGAVGELIFAKTQIPDVVWLIAAGFVLRVTGLVNPDDLTPVLPLFAAITLIIVLFEGGSKLVVRQLVKAAPRASILAIVGFLVTTFFVAGVTMLAGLSGLMGDNWTFSHGLMVGAMVGGSSSLIIMPSMSLAKVDDKVSNLVGLESAFTDALCVVGAVAMMKIVASGNMEAGPMFIDLGKNFGIAMGVGIVAGWTWMPVLRVLRGSQHAYPVTIAALIFLYVVVARLGGNSAMAILAFAVIVGNAQALMKMLGFKLGDAPIGLDDTVRKVHEQASFIIKSFFFTFIGLMLGGRIPWLILGVVLGLALLAARLPVVHLLVRGEEFDPSDRRLVLISLPRGMAAGVLATMPFTDFGLKDLKELPALVFSTVVVSIIVFAIGFRKARASMAPPAPDAATPGAGPPGEALPEGAAAPAGAADPNAPPSAAPAIAPGHSAPGAPVQQAAPVQADPGAPVQAAVHPTTQPAPQAGAPQQHAPPQSQPQPHAHVPQPAAHPAPAQPYPPQQPAPGQAMVGPTGTPVPGPLPTPPAQAPHAPVSPEPTTQPGLPPGTNDPGTSNPHG